MTLQVAANGGASADLRWFINCDEELSEKQIVIEARPQQRSTHLKRQCKFLDLCRAGAIKEVSEMLREAGASAPALANWTMEWQNAPDSTGSSGQILQGDPIALADLLSGGHEARGWHRQRERWLFTYGPNKYVVAKRHVIGRDRLAECVHVRSHSGLRLGALHEAALGDGRSTAALVPILLEYGADPLVCNSSGQLPLHIAASCGNFEFVHELLRCSDVIARAQSRAVDLRGRTALCCALHSLQRVVGGGRWRQRMIVLGVESDGPGSSSGIDNCSSRLCQWAAATEIAKHQRGHSPALPSCDKWGTYADAAWRCTWGKEGIVDRLSAIINLTISTSFMSPDQNDEVQRWHLVLDEQVRGDIFDACAACACSRAQYLLEARARLSGTSERSLPILAELKFSALHQACCSSRAERSCVRQILRAAAEATRVGEVAATLLSVSRAADAARTVCNASEYLLQCHQQRQRLVDTLLEWVCAGSNGKEKLEEELYRQDNSGRTALHHAVASGDLLSCARLLEWALTRVTSKSVSQGHTSIDDQALVGRILRLTDQAVDAAETEEAFEASNLLARDGKIVDTTPARASIRCVFRMIEACDAHGHTVLHTSIEAARQRRRIWGAANRAVSCIEVAERCTAADYSAVACEADNTEYGGYCAVVALLVGVAQRVTGMHCSRHSLQSLLERRDAIGYSPLHIAASLGEHTAVSLLLAGGAQVNQRAGDHYYRRTVSVHVDSESSAVHLSRDIGSRCGISHDFARCPAATRQQRLLNRVLICSSARDAENNFVDPARSGTNHAHMEEAKQALWHIRSVGAPGTDIVRAQRRAKAAVLDALRCWHEKARNLAQIYTGKTICGREPCSAFSLFRECRPVLGGTALSLAIKAASPLRARHNAYAAFLDTVRTLLRHQVDTSIADESNCCFMMHVSVAKDINVTKIVRNVMYVQGQTGITQGIVRGVREACSACANCSAMIGITPLQLAAGTGQLHVVKLLMRYGASLLQSPTALHSACAWSSPLCGFGGGNDVEDCACARAGIVYELLSHLNDPTCSGSVRVQSGSKDFVRAVVNSAAPIMLSAQHVPTSKEVPDALTERHAASLRTPLGIAFWGTAGFNKTDSSIAADCATAKMACRDGNFSYFARACMRSRHRASVFGIRGMNSMHCDSKLLSALFHFGASIGNVKRASAELLYPNSFNSPCSVDYHYQIGFDLLTYEAFALNFSRQAQKLVCSYKDGSSRNDQEQRFAIQFEQLRSHKPQRKWRIGAQNVLIFLEMLLPPLPRGAFDCSRYDTETVADNNWCWWSALPTNYFSLLHCIARRPNNYMSHNDEQLTSRAFEMAESGIEMISVQLLGDVWPCSTDESTSVLDSIQQARKRWSQSVLQRWRLCLRRAIVYGYRNLTQELTRRGVRCFDALDLNDASGKAVPLASLVAMSEAMWYRCACTWPANEHVSVDVVCEIDELRKCSTTNGVSCTSLCRIALASLAGIAASAGHLDAIAVSLADICWQTDGLSDIWIGKNSEEQLKQALIADDTTCIRSERTQAMLLCLRMTISSCYEPARTTNVWDWLMPQFIRAGLISKLHENLIPSSMKTEHSSPTTFARRTNMLVACAAAGHAEIVTAMISHLQVSASSDAGSDADRNIFSLHRHVDALCLAAEHSILGGHDHVALQILHRIKMERDTVLLGGWRVLRAACWRGSVIITRWFLDNCDYKCLYQLSSTAGFCPLKYARAAGHEQIAKCLTDANFMPSKDWMLILYQSTACARDLQENMDPTKHTVLLCGVFRKVMQMNEASVLSKAEHFAFFWPRELRSSQSLHWLPAAAAIGLPGVVQALLDAGAADVGFEGQGSVDSLFCCAHTHELSPSVTPMSQAPSSQLRTSLGWAAVSGSCESVNTLLLAGADPNGMASAHPSPEGRIVAPIFEATRRHYWNVTCALVRAGAEISSNETIVGHNLMHSIVVGSVEAGSSGAADGRDMGLDMMRLLTLVQLHSQQLTPEHNLLTGCDNGGMQPLETAAALGKVNMVLWLLRNGVTAESAASSPCKYALQWLPSAKHREWFSHFVLSEARHLSVEALSETGHRAPGRGHQVQSLLNTIHCIRHHQHVMHQPTAPSIRSMRNIAMQQKQLRPVMNVLNLEEQLELLSSRKERNMVLQTPFPPWLIRQYNTYLHRSYCAQSCSLDRLCGRLTSSDELRCILEAEMHQSQPFHDGSPCFPARFMQQRIVYTEGLRAPLQAFIEKKACFPADKSRSAASFTVHDQGEVSSGSRNMAAGSTILLHGLPRDHQHYSCMGVYRLLKSVNHDAEIACAFEQVLSLAAVPVMRPHALYFKPAPENQTDKLGHWFVSRHIGTRSARLIGTVSTAHTNTCLEASFCSFQAASRQFYTTKLDAHCWPTSAAEVTWHMSNNACFEPLCHEMSCSVMPFFSNDWIPLARVKCSAKTNNLHVMGLSHDTSYEFRVIASSSSNRKVLAAAEVHTRQLHFGDRTVHIASALRKWLCHTARRDCRQVAFDRFAGRVSHSKGSCCSLDGGMPANLLLKVEAELLVFERRKTNPLKPVKLMSAAQCAPSRPKQDASRPEISSGEDTAMLLRGDKTAASVDSARFTDTFSTTFVDLMTSACEVEPCRLMKLQRKLSKLREAADQLKENRSRPYTKSCQ